MPSAVNHELVEKIRELGDQATANTGVEIAEVQLRGAGNSRLLRLYIDKAGGVTHSDCELVSRRISELLDEFDTMPEGSYTLEVSSLGADRKLKTPRDYERVAGQRIAVSLQTPAQGKTLVEGKLLQVRDGLLDLELSSGETVEVSLDQVAKAKLKFEP